MFMLSLCVAVAASCTVSVNIYSLAECKGLLVATGRVYTRIDVTAAAMRFCKSAWIRI